MTHIEPLLRAHLLHQQHLRDPQLHPDVRNRLAVHKVLLQPHVPPHGLHHAQAHGVVVVFDLYGWKLVYHTAGVWLEPSDQCLVSL